MSIPQKSSYAIIPSYILDDENLDEGAKNLYARISMYSQDGRCWASNQHFADKQKVTTRCIQKWLKQLVDAEYIHVEVERGGFQTKRDIWITNDFKKFNTKRTTVHPQTNHNSCHNEPQFVQINTSDINIKNIKEPCDSVASASNDAVSLCSFFIEQLKKLKPDIKLNTKNWEQDFDKILRIDKRCPERLRQMIEWIHNDGFWKTNILSPGKLRKQYDRIELEMQGNAEKDIIRKNRQFALKLKDQYPDKFKGLTFDEKFVVNRSTAKEIPFNLPEKTFQKVLVSLFGGVLND
jgi:hypothetical protein